MSRTMGKRLRLYICERHKSGGKSLYDVLLEKARSMELAGCTVFQGKAGYGSRRHLHELHLLSFSDDLPLVVEIVDSEEKVAGFLNEIEELLGNATATLEDIEIIHFSVEREGQRK